MNTCQRKAFLSGLTALAVGLAVPGISGAQEVRKAPEAKTQIVDMGTYRVSAPPGKWTVEYPPKVPILTFSQHKEGLLNQLAGQERAMVIALDFKELEPQHWYMDENEAGEDQIKTWIVIESNDPEADVKVLDKGETQLGERRVYFVKFSETYLDQGFCSDRNIYFYFPSTFRKHHKFFCFQSSFAHTMNRKLYKDPGTEPLAAVIGSLEIVEPLAAVAGPDGDLLRASNAGDLEAVRQAIAKGGNVNASTTAGTPLSIAALNGRRDIVELLLAQGADLNKGDEQARWTPLARSIVGGETEIAELLIGRGADVNLTTKKGFSPLMSAICMHLSPLVTLLLDRGAAVDGGTEDGDTPLIFAARAGSMEIVKSLLDRGAGLDVQTKAGESALMAAATARHEECATFLVDRGANVNLSSKKGWTALLAAIDSGDPALAALLVGRGAEVNAKSSSGWTPLMEAAESGDMATAKLLLEKGADVNARAEKKTTALKLAKYKKNAELVKIFQAAGAK